MSRPRKVLLVTGMAGYLVALDLTIVNVAFPDLASSFAGTTPATLAHVLSGYSIAGAVLLSSAVMALGYRRPALTDPGAPTASISSDAPGRLPGSAPLAGPAAVVLTDSEVPRA